MTRLPLHSIVGLVVLATLSIASATTTLTLELVPTSGTTVPPNGMVSYKITGVVPNDGNLGLAAFGVDVLTNTGVRQSQAKPDAAIKQYFTQLGGFTNPIGFGGTSADGDAGGRDDDLLQIGGSQNTIGNDGIAPNPRYPSGTVQTGLAVGTPIVLATGTVKLPATAATYTVSLGASPFGAVLVGVIGGTPPAYTTQMTRTQLGANNSFDVTVVQGMGTVHNVTRGIWYSTIGAALWNPNLQNGDEVVVMPGVYNERVIIPTGQAARNFTLRSFDPTDPSVVAATVIDAGWTGGPVLAYHGDNTADMVVSGFTLRRGYSANYPGGVSGAGSYGTLSYCMITDNQGGSGGGIGSLQGAITNCLIKNNRASGFGGGLFACSGTISSCTIAMNRASYFGGGLGNCVQAILQNCVVTGNFGGAGGGGLGGTTPATIRGCTITGNRTDGNGGGIWFTVQTHSVRNSIIYGNAAGGNGNQLAVTGGTVAMSYSDVPNGTNDIYGTINYEPGNLTGAPGFQPEPSGTWSTSPWYDPVADQTTLTDASASLTPGALVNLLLEPAPDYYRACLIAANSETTITVWGNANGVESGDSYRVIEYHLQEGSPCINAADPNYTPGPTETDIDGGARKLRDRVDIGADEVP
jgi:hypothetical protein